MNRSNQGHYEALILKADDRFYRRRRCALCGYSVQHRSGRGSGRNALASAAQLTGEVAKHLRETHPDELEQARRDHRED